MTTSRMLALSAVDGRYAPKTAPLATIFSEASLNTHRLTIEVEYLIALSSLNLIRKLSSAEKKQLRLLAQPKPQQLERIKEIEAKTHHDVKAIEYYLKENIQKTSLQDISPFVHFALTSEDVNNLAYRLMIQQGLQAVLLPSLFKSLLKLTQLAEQYQAQPMLARTHGQPAIPTTFGKELAVFIARLLPLLKDLHQFQFVGKLNGAVGGYQSFYLANPKINWLKFSKQFVESLNLKFLPITTQINPQDDLVSLFQKLYHLNQILIGLNQDMWRYISDDWLLQKTKKGSVGSSTMPQKVNPIEFENSEGNLKMANGILQVFIDSLPVSRLQRDLSDSTVARNFGLAFGHCLLAYISLHQGLSKIRVNQTKMEQALSANWNILAEAGQILARQKGDLQAYEKLAKASKQKNLNKEDWQKLAKNIDHKLLKITPENYLGLSKKITQQTIKQSYQLIRLVMQ